MNDNLQTANNLVLNNHFFEAIGIYTDEINSKNNEIGYLGRMLAFTIWKCIYNNQVDEKFITRDVEFIKTIDKTAYANIKDYFINTLYEDPLFDRIMEFQPCIANICKAFRFDPKIIELFFSYYININTQNLSTYKMFRLDNDIVSFSRFVKQNAPASTSEFGHNILTFAKQEFLEENYFVYPFFGASVELFDTEESRFYYYLSFLLSYMYTEDPYQMFDKLLFTQNNTRKIGKTLINHNKELILTILQSCTRELQHIDELPPVLLDTYLTTRINVIMCILQIVDGYYYQIEDIVIDLLKIFKFYIGRKILGFGVENNTISTFCKEDKEYKLLLHIYKDVLNKYGTTVQIKHKLHIKPALQNNNNSLIIPYIEKDIDSMFAYANATL